MRLFFDAMAESRWEPGPEPDELDFAVESITDADGAVELTFENRLSPETRYRIHLEVEAVGWVTLRLPPLRYTPRGTWELPEVLSLGALPLRRGHRLEGRVVSASGSPVPGATLIAVGRNYRESTASHLRGVVSDAEGRFVLPLLEAGSYRIVVDAVDYEGVTRTVEVAPGAGPTVLQLVEALPLSGRVLDSEGRGLAGIDVTLSSNDDGFGDVVGDLDTATSDANGRFRLDRGPSEPGSITLNVSRSACRRDRWSSEALRQRGGLRLDEPIRCLPPTELVVAVHGSDSEPVEGAHVTVHRERDLQTRAGPVGPSETHFLAVFGPGPPHRTTDLKGTATFRNLLPGPVTVSVGLDGYENRTVNGRVSLSSENPVALEVELEAVETRELEVRVEDHQGRPVSSVRLDVTSDTDTGYYQRVCILDKDGRCTIDLWPVALHDLDLGLTSAEYDEYDHQYTARTPPTGEPLLLTLPPPERARFAVKGRIVDRHGQPVTSARLESSDFAHIPRFVDENGTFELYRISEGKHDIEVSAPGFAEHDDEIEIRPDTAEITIVLDPPVRIRGRLSVRDAASGAAPPEMLVRAVRGGTTSLRGAISGDSYTIDGAGPGRWRLEASTDGSSVDEVVEIPQGVSEVVVDLELPPPHLLRGTITLDGEPLRSRRIEFWEQLQSLSWHVDLENGRFETRLQSGRWWLSLFDDRGYHEREIDVRGDLDIGIDLQTAPIQGRVVDSATGSGIEGITLRATTGPWTSVGSDWKTATDDDGRFDFGRLLTGSWTLALASDIGLRPSDNDPIWLPVEPIEPVELDAGGADVEIVLVAASTLEIVARYTDGEPLASVFVRLFIEELMQAELRRIEAERAAGRRGDTPVEVFDAMEIASQEVRLDAGGRGTITSAPAGRYLLEAEGVHSDPPFSTTSATLTIPGPPVELTFERRGIATLKLPGLEPHQLHGRPPESRATLLVPTDPAYDGPRTVDSRWFALGLAPGQWQIKTTVDGLSMTCVVEIVDGRRHPCVLEP